MKPDGYESTMYAIATACGFVFLSLMLVLGFTVLAALQEVL